MLDYGNLVSQILGAGRDRAANLMTLQADLIALSSRELRVADDGLEFPFNRSSQRSAQTTRRPMALRLEADYAGNGNVGDTIYTGGTLAVGLDNGFTVGGSLQYGNANPDYGGLSYDGDFWAASAYVRQRSPDATGLTWKLGAGFSRVDSDVTREATLANTEEGTGNTKIDNAVALAEIGYGVRRGRSIIVPRLSLIHSTGTNDGYTESDTIAFPVTYDDYDFDLTLATLAADVFVGLTSNTMLEFVLGIESDLHRSSNTVTGSSLATADFAIGVPEVLNKNRAFASVNLRRRFAPGRILEGRLGLRQSPFTDELSHSAGISYIVNF